MDLILKILNATLVFKRLKIGMDESIDGCGNCMHAMMQRKLYLYISAVNRCSCYLRGVYFGIFPVLIYYRMD